MFIILFGIFHTDITVPYGESYPIECTAIALPPAQIKWKLPSATEFKIVDGPLIIDAMQFSDEGLYECMLDNGIEPVAMRQVKIIGDANSSPNISKPSVKQLNVFEGDDIILYCHCEMCQPLTLLMWNHENHMHENRTNDSNVGIKMYDNANIIDYPWSFKNISVENSGIYTCIMHNDYGSDTYSIEVNVRQSPKIATLQETSSYHKCTSNQYAHSVELESENSNLTLPSNVYDCSASDAHSSDITIVLLGKFICFKYLQFSYMKQNKKIHFFFSHRQLESIHSMLEYIFVTVLRLSSIYNNNHLKIS